MKAHVYVTLKKGVLDPQGRAIVHALEHLDFNNVEDVSQGKFFEVTLKETDEAKAKEALEAMCEKLLANTVIENYRFELVA